MGGSREGAGRHRAQTAHTLQAAIQEVLTEEKWRKIVTKAAEQALEGDHTARAWLADRAAGKAVQRTELDAAIGHLSDAELLALLNSPHDDDRPTTDGEG